MLRGNLVRMISCEGHCFKEFVALEDMMVKSEGDGRFCVQKYDGCERATVNVHLPKNEENGKGDTVSLTRETRHKMFYSCNCMCCKVRVGTEYDVQPVLSDFDSVEQSS